MKPASQSGCESRSLTMRDDDLVGHELTCVHVALGLEPEVGALRDVLAEDVTRRDVGETVRLDDLARLRALARTRSAQKNDVHRTAHRSLRRPT